MQLKTTLQKFLLDCFSFLVPKSQYNNQKKATQFKEIHQEEYRDFEKARSMTGHLVVVNLVDPKSGVGKDGQRN